MHGTSPRWPIISHPLRILHGFNRVNLHGNDRLAKGDVASRITASPHVTSKVNFEEPSFHRRPCRNASSGQPLLDMRSASIIEWLARKAPRRG